MPLGGKKNNDGNKDDTGLNRSYWQALNASSAGLVFFLSIGVGVGIGYYSDQFFGTKPYLLLFFMIMGIIAGFRNLWLFVKRSSKNVDDDRQNDDKK